MSGLGKIVSKIALPAVLGYFTAGLGAPAAAVSGAVTGPGLAGLPGAIHTAATSGLSGMSAGMIGALKGAALGVASTLLTPEMPEFDTARQAATPQVPGAPTMPTPEMQVPDAGTGGGTPATEADIAKGSAAATKRRGRLSTILSQSRLTEPLGGEYGIETLG